jgi:hypothetical protein
MTTPSKPASVIERAGRTGVAMVATPGGGWLFDWEPNRATFTAAHLRQAPPGWPAEVDYDLGCRRGEIVSPLALEEALGFALPLAIHAVLGAERDNRPAFAVRRVMRRAAVEVAEARPRPADTFPLWSSPSGPVWGALAPWGLSLARDQQRNVATVNLGDAIVFEIIERCPGSGRFSHRDGYRLSAWDAVVFAGDVAAPRGGDLAADDIVRAVIDVISRRRKPLAARQEAFLETLAEALLEAEHSGILRSRRADGRRR